VRYVNDGEPGISRRRHGAGFAYVHPDGRRVRDAATLDRIRAIVIPPAWTDVWICSSADGHIQATGRDARRRKQYRYHPAWVASRDQAKYERMIEFANALPRLRRQIDKHLTAPALSRTRVLATVVRLLERTLIRVGNEEYARANRSYGLTTLQNRHVRVRGSHLEFTFRAKSGVAQQIELDDPRLAKIVRRLQELPGQKLFQYVDADGTIQKIGSSDVNEYLKQIAGTDFTAKDFRTWFGTVLAGMALQEIAAAHPDEKSEAARKRHVIAAIDQVKDALGNTRAVCRKCYIHPAIMNGYLQGQCIRLTGRDRPGAQRPAVERAVLKFLRQAA
jgi:DNA topoisomerase I